MLLYQTSIYSYLCLSVGAGFSTNLCVYCFTLYVCVFYSRAYQPAIQ